MEYLIANSVHPLTTFLEYISYEYMIENVMLLLRGTMTLRDANELIEQCHPLGMFKDFMTLIFGLTCLKLF